MSEFWRVIMAGLVVAVVSYALGSFNFAIMISRCHKAKDIRNFGSGNAGMTNMLRTFGKRAATYTFLGDFAKGVLAVFLGRLIFTWMGIGFDGGSIAGVFVVIGHIFPLYFGFKGGKGVSTAFGVMLMLNWMVFLAIAVGLVPMLFVIRIVSAVSLTGAAMFPVLTFLVGYLQGEDIVYSVIPSTVCALLIAGLAFYAHRDNVKRLREGRENAFVNKKKEVSSNDAGEQER